MAKKIHFSRHDDGPYIYEPKPSSKILPDWYKKASSYFNDEKKPQVGKSFATVKRCVPVFDAMTAGYIIRLERDLYCEQLPDGPYFHWRTDVDTPLELITQHTEFQVQGHPDNNLGYQLKIENPWIIKTDPGYSCMIVPPMHRDNDLIVLPGIVDTDKYYEKIALPFNLKNKNFEGMLEAGTPIAQIIPFKRESYSMEVVKLDKERSVIHKRTIASKIYDSYRSLFWSRKEYK
jgi:hypothetical protein